MIGYLTQIQKVYDSKYSTLIVLLFPINIRLHPVDIFKANVSQLIQRPFRFIINQHKGLTQVVIKNVNSYFNHELQSHKLINDIDSKVPRFLLCVVNDL